MKTLCDLKSFVSAAGASSLDLQRIPTGRFPFIFLIIGALSAWQCNVSGEAGRKSPAPPQVSGRSYIDVQGVTHLYWPGNAISTRFSGSYIKAKLKDEHGHNQYYILVDNQPQRILQPDSILKTYTLAANLPGGIHTLTLYRLTDWFEGETSFYGFEYAPHSHSYPIEPAKRSMVFYGNSITVGAGQRQRSTDKSIPPVNNYFSYAALTARHFKAKYTCIASSGIGLMVSWGQLTMPDIYDRLNPADSNSHADFTHEQPDIVVVNLLQNDCSLFPLTSHPQFKRRFGNKAPTADSVIKCYRNFIGTLRKKYPKSSIICTLGSMSAVASGSPWPRYITEAVAALRDPNIYSFFFRYLGGEGHPNPREQAAMARALIQFIHSKTGWN